MKSSIYIASSQIDFIDKMENDDDDDDGRKHHDDDKWTSANEKYICIQLLTFWNFKNKNLKI